jgi:hypothetical protein
VRGWPGVVAAADQLDPGRLVVGGQGQHGHRVGARVRKMPGLMITPMMIKAMITTGSTSSCTGIWRSRALVSIVGVSTAISHPAFVV